MHHPKRSGQLWRTPPTHPIEEAGVIVVAQAQRQEGGKDEVEDRAALPPRGHQEQEKED